MAAPGNLQYHTPTALKPIWDTISSSCAVSVPNGTHTVHVGGHLGFNEEGGFSTDLKEEIEQVFRNIEMTLHEAGVADGWASVFQINTYQSQARIPDEDEFFGVFIATKEKYMRANHCIWSNVLVPGLHGGAAVEVTVSAVKNASEKIGPRM
jgi:enamine deaminase RidA (YjgF/YER057c/UK114 family)